MNFYDDLVMQTQMNYSKYYPIYASGSTPYQLTDKKPLPYSEQIDRLVQEIKEADCVVVGGASGLSAAGGGDFYYEDNDSYRKYFRPFAEKYHDMNPKSLDKKRIKRPQRSESCIAQDSGRLVLI